MQFNFEFKNEKWRAIERKYEMKIIMGKHECVTLIRDYHCVHRI